jgi:RNA-binding protein NOB1
MVFSYSAIARAATAAPDASTSTAAAGPSSQTGIQHMILDAGPLLSLTPLRHLATTFHTTPQVLAELRDPKAREHWENLKIQGLDIRVEPPSAESMAKVIAFAKKTGDYAVLSTTDLGVVALTYQYEVAVNGDARIRTAPGQKLTPLTVATQEEEKKDEESDEESDMEEVEVEIAEEGEEEAAPKAEAVEEAATEPAAEPAAESAVEPVTAPAETAPAVEELTKAVAELSTEAAPAPTPAPVPSAKIAADEESESDGGEWITPSNVKHHRSKDLGLLPDDARSKAAPLAAACMTGDYAVQNVLLGMGLGLVGEAGKRISKVRSWVLRCHACFKLCKDSSKRFCPSCGNSTLMRTTVSTSAVTGKQTIHLKKNFQYHLRGTKYSIPDPKPGRAKGQLKGGSGLILREDQLEWQDAVYKNNRQREKEERRAAKGEGSWMDPDVS